MPPTEPSSARPCIPLEARRYSSKLDATRGALRTTSDGNLISEVTGDYVLLGTPVHDQEDREMRMQKEKKIAKRPTIGLPEAKNGATGLDNSRKPKTLVRVLLDIFSGSNHPPKEVEDPATQAKRDLRSELLARQDEREKIDSRILEKIQIYYASELSQKLGSDWFEHAMVDPEYWQHVQETVLKLDIQ